MRCLIGRVFRAYYTKADPKKPGVRVRVYTKAYYCEFVDHAGKQKRKKGYTDKGATLQLLAKLERESAQARQGLRATHNHAERTLADLQADYLGTLTARGSSTAYLRTVKDHLDAVLPACRFFTVHDFDADRLTRWLFEREHVGKRKKDAPKVKPSPATLNTYLRTVKGFARWCQRKTGVLIDLAEAKKLPEAPDRRRSKRLLTEKEFAALLTAAERCPKRRGTVIPGKDRAMLYRVAAYTGLRASELASLTPESFDLAGKPPTVRIEAEHEKAGRGETLPIFPHLLKALKPWLKGKPAGKRLWPGNWAESGQQSDWIARDVRRAKIAAKDDQGRGIMFHSLRRRYVTGLIRSGADIAQIKRLARHKDLKTTLEFYETSSMAELAAAVGRMPK